MKRALIVYYSNTGNTEVIADDIYTYISKKYVTDMSEVQDFDINLINQYEVVFLGCPASGAEELEENVFLPFYLTVKDSLKNKKVGLFGAFDWGNGEWMEKWKIDAQQSGIDIIDVLPVNNRKLDTYNIENYISKFY